MALDTGRGPGDGGEESPRSHGSGLGLWLTSWVVEASSGELRFAENEPRGSVVRFDLPVADEPPAAAVDASIPAPESW